MEKKRSAAILSAVLLAPVLFGWFTAAAGAQTAGGTGDSGSLAEASARAILGSRTPLEQAKVGPYVLYSCRNGYVLADPADGRVEEYALSFPGKPPVFDRPVQEPVQEPEQEPAQGQEPGRLTT